MPHQEERIGEKLLRVSILQADEWPFSAQSIQSIRPIQPTKS